MRSSCLILPCLFLSTLALEKIMLSSHYDDLTRRPLIQIIADLPFSNLSYGGPVFDKFTEAISSQE